VFIVSVALKVVDPRVAEIDADVVDETAIVVTLNVVEVVPAGTVTLAGTVAEVDPDDNVTVVPFGPA
jgi:uncharacterized membrane protein